MKKIVLLLTLAFFATTVTAQDKIAVFVYSTTKLNQPINALRSKIEEALNKSAEKSYIVVDRTEEFKAILIKEYGYQEQGNVSNSQLVAAGQQLGANKVCGVVISDYGNEGYFIECVILDVKENRKERIANFPKDDETIHDLGIATSKRVATSLASQLNLLSIDQEKRYKAIQDSLRDAQTQEIEKQRRDHERKQRKEEFLCFMTSPTGSLLSSAIIPGLGLINKGHSGWGTTILLSEVGLAAGIVLTYSNAQSQLKTMKDPNVTADAFTAANTQYTRMKVANHIFIGAAAAVYIANLVATVTSKNNSSHVCSVVPAFDQEGNIIPTLSFTINL